MPINWRVAALKATREDLVIIKDEQNRIPPPRHLSMRHREKPICGMHNYPELFERGREGSRACEQKATRAKGKKVKSLYLTSIVSSVTRLVLMDCLCQCSVLQVFKAMATRIIGKSKQTLGH